MEVEAVPGGLIMPEYEIEEIWVEDTIDPGFSSV